MIITAGKSHIGLAQDVADKLAAPIIIANTKQFADQEFRIQIDGYLHQQDIAILQSTAKPANDHLMELLLIADAAKRAGARSIIAVMPYFGYGRQDRPSYNHGPISASLVARLIEASGVDRLITIDLHSKQAEGFFKIGVQNLESQQLFIPLFKQLQNCVVISPDIGGLPRARAFADAMHAELALINKSRKQNGACVMSKVIGKVNGKNCILIDDIIDTGATLCQAAQLLRRYGAKSVNACVTHAVFSGNCLSMIKNAGFDRFYITNTIQQATIPKGIATISVSKLLADELRDQINGSIPIAPEDARSTLHR